MSAFPIHQDNDKSKVIGAVHIEDDTLIEKLSKNLLQMVPIIMTNDETDTLIGFGLIPRLGADTN